MRDRLSAPRRALPPVRAGHRPGRGDARRQRTGAGRSCSRRSAAGTTGGACGCAGRPTRPPRCWPIRSRSSPRSTSASTPNWPRSWPGRRTGRRPRTRWCRPCSAAGSVTRCWRPRRGCRPAGRCRRSGSRWNSPPSSASPGCSRWSCSARQAGLLVNELAMRPHNSGHWTIEGARTSQFEQHLRAVLDLPLGDPRAAAPCVAMANVFGATDPGVYARYTHVMAADPGVKLNMYGKPCGRAARSGTSPRWATTCPALRAARRPRRGLPGHGRGVTHDAMTAVPWSGWSWAATRTGR